MTARLFDLQEPCSFGHANKCGVYAVCVNHYRFNVSNPNERILYIGSSKDIGKRLQNSKHPYQIIYNRFDEMLVYIKTIYCDDYEELEKLLIGAYRPLLNKTHKNG